jgi:hypothetical protein
MGKCKKCGEDLPIISGKCRCERFIVFDEDGEDNDIYEINAYWAALKYAEESNINRENYLMDNICEITVIGEDGERSEFSISAEPDVCYHASEVKRDSEGEMTDRERYIQERLKERQEQ